MSVRPWPLVNPIRTYAWGSRNFIAELQGRASPSAEPEAELWLGAHSTGSSELDLGTERVALSSWLSANVEAGLGSGVAAQFRSELPFLMKVLAAAEPLSLQAHPSSEQAAAGFAREEATGIPCTANERNYKDDRHKPELICALTPFQALCGFRKLETTRRLFAELGASEIDDYLAPLGRDDASAAYAGTLQSLLAASADERALIARATAERAAERATHGEFAREFAWVTRLSALYPGDVGVTCALLLNLVELAPYQALYLPAGNLHAYLEGAGIEIMASSDNVLRGGLTPKPINVPELLHVLDFQELEPELIEPAAVSSYERVYRTPAREFQLSYLDVHGSVEPERSGGPEILLTSAGELRLVGNDAELALPRGQAVFVPARAAHYRLLGEGQAFRATVPEARGTH